MKIRLKYFFAGVFLLLNFLVVSQNEASKWYFGGYAGLDFMTSPPTVLTNGVCNTYEGSACVADAAGNLLFYTDGSTIWNQSHVVMANGAGLFGASSTSQAALIVKQPGSNTVYFVFTLDEYGGSDGLRYSVVDMTLAAGMGSVTTRNVLIHAPSSEKLCGVKHCNGTDVWVVSHDFASNNFRANLVTATGVNTTAVISSIGSNISQLISTAGCMKISPNGKKLGLAVYYPPGFELYDFNTATGVVSDLIQLPVLSPATEYAYGCEFSPDGTKFYGTSDSENKLYQWDLCYGSPGAIISSQHTIAATETEELQLGPDGKIYMARANWTNSQPSTESILGVLNDPDANFSAVNYINTGQSVSPKVSTAGLPNFISGFYKTPVAAFTYTVDPTVNCLSASFTAPALINNTCSATSYTVDHLAWLFDDPASGAANTSVLSNPTHSYPGNGVYHAKLILYNACGGVIDTLRKQVLITQVPIATSSSGFSLCAGQSMTLTASGLSTYSWSTGATTNTLGIAPGSTTTYTVEGLGLNGCPLRSVQEVTVNTVPAVSIAGSNTACAGSALMQTASGAYSYTWSTGSNGAVLSITPTVAGVTTYSVIGDASGCISHAAVTVTLFPAPPLTVTAPNSVCLGSSAVLTAAGAATYSWSTHTAQSSITLSPLSSQPYTVTGTGSNGCKSIKTGTLTVYHLPAITISGNHPVCSGSALTLTASGASFYSWSNGYSAAAISFSPNVAGAYLVTATATTGCIGTASVMVNVIPSPSLTVSSASVCSGGTTALSVISTTVGGTNYAWLPGAINATSIQASGAATKIYTVIATGTNGCKASVHSTLTVIQPKVLAGFSYTAPVCEGATDAAPKLDPGFSAGGHFFSNVVIDAVTGHVTAGQTPAGNYLVTYSVSLSGCTQAITVPLNILPVPRPATDLSIKIAPGASATLHVSGVNNYTWSPADSLSCSSCDSPVASPATDRQYCVVSTLGACTASACVNVIVTCETTRDFSVPNAFTPNGDGTNDAFCLQGWDECTSDFRVLIFDRWGEKVFESGDPMFCWDGTYNGKLLNAGVYVYAIHVKKFKGEALDRKGNITLIR